MVGLGSVDDFSVDAFCMHADVRRNVDGVGACEGDVLGNEERGGVECDACGSALWHMAPEGLIAFFDAVVFNGNVFEDTAPCLVGIATKLARIDVACDSGCFNDERARKV